MKTHLTSMFGDRAADARINHLAALGLRMDKGPNILSLSFDGMDQCKFKVPRNTASSKDPSGVAGKAREGRITQHAWPMRCKRNCHASHQPLGRGEAREG
jgi:hypothetical protein